MTAKWGICALLIGLLALTSGCRTPQPNLKPAGAEMVERFPELPEGAYASPGMPRQAFSTMADPARASLDTKGSGVMPARSTMGPGGMGGR